MLKEKPPTADERKALKGDRDLVISFGAVLGAEFSVVDGKLVAKRKVKHFRSTAGSSRRSSPAIEGNIFFVHTKYLLIDPLSDDPLICTGSANFSEGSLTNNDENMILIRGSTRVADIYMTEFDRLFRHFYFRDVANDVESKAQERREAGEGLPRSGRQMDRRAISSPADSRRGAARCSSISRRQLDRSRKPTQRRTGAPQKEEGEERDGKQ